MYDNNYNGRTFEEEYASIRGMNAFIAKVFGWMFIGLMLTAGVSFYVASTPSLVYGIVNNPILLFGLFIGEIVLVSVLSARITRLRTVTAAVMFLIYAVLNGITLSFVLLIYTGESVASAFGITALTFGIMSVYGYFTRADLTRFRNILFMGLIGVLVLSVVNMFLGSSGLGWLISMLSLFVFLGLTAHDMQTLKGYYFGTEGNEVLRGNIGIIGALGLYLDFVNLFLIFLRLFGRSRD